MPLSKPTLERLDQELAKIQLRSAPDSSDSSAPYCWRCGQHVTPRYENRSQGAVGYQVDIPGEVDPMLFRPLTERVAVCPNCGERISDSKKYDRESLQWKVWFVCLGLGLVIGLILFLTVGTGAFIVWEFLGLVIGSVTGVVGMAVVSLFK
jgi:predicted RNA-binding Zn-ribbon protein involved in translation (DUF1610 family)